MSIRRVLVITRSTPLEAPALAHRHPAIARLLATDDPLVARMRLSLQETQETRQQVLHSLREHGMQVTYSRRVREPVDAAQDLVVTVGGDGTVLDAARLVRTTPVLGVNSSPSTSYGHFTCCTAETFPRLLTQVLEDRMAPRTLTRIALRIDGTLHPRPALNDVLLADRVPAATSRYLLEVAGESEVQKSSGIWISTAAGSTGAIRSAGGIPMELSDSRLQYRVREPCCPPGCTLRLLGGILDGPLVAISRMLHGAVFLDGRRTAVPLRFGSRIEVSNEAPPLRIFLASDGESPPVMAPRKGPS